jgi:hypothetical protein
MTGGTGAVGTMAIPRKSKARDRFEDADTKPNARKMEPEPKATNAEFVVVDHEISPARHATLSVQPVRKHLIGPEYHPPQSADRFHQSRSKPRYVIQSLHPRGQSP